MSPTIYGVDEQGNLLKAPYTVTQSQPANPFYSIIPSPTIPVYQGPHLGMTNTHGNPPDNWSSESYLAAGAPGNPTGRPVLVLETDDGTYTDPLTGVLLEANSASQSEYNTAGREATEMPRFPGAADFYPGAHFFMRTSFYVPSPFTSWVGHYDFNEFFGFPLSLPTWGIAFHFGTPPQLVVCSQDAWGQPNSLTTTGSHTTTYIDHNWGSAVGAGLLDCWHDFVWEFQCNTLHMGDATKLVHGGISNQWIPDNNGWYRGWWIKQAAGSAFQQGSLIPLKSSGGGGNGINPNYPNGVPAVDAQGNVPPAGAVGANLCQPNMNCPVSGTAWNFGMWTYAYTDTQSLANSGTKGHLKHFVDSTITGPTLASIGL